MRVALVSSDSRGQPFETGVLKKPALGIGKLLEALAGPHKVSLVLLLLMEAIALTGMV